MILFFHPDLTADQVQLSLEESKHCVKAFRMRAGDELFLTNGKGMLAEARLQVADIHECVVTIMNRKQIPSRSLQLHIAIAPTKNADRMEWFVEKAVEIGIEKITFIICQHSERFKIDLARMQRIAIAALKQSQTTILPKLNVCSFEDFLEQQKDTPDVKYIAWCDDNNTKQLCDESIPDDRILVLIGPEGDFSTSEIERCRQMGCKEIKLGNRRLRTETAALYTCCMIAAKEMLKTN